MQSLQYIETLRESVTSVLGAPPDPAPLRPQTLDCVEMPDYRCEHVTYQLSPNDWGFAYLLLPTDVSAPAPAVYCHHRHRNDFRLGKEDILTPSDDSGASLAVELVRRGYAVFAPDALGFGERRHPDSDGHAFDQAYNFYQLATRLLRGETLLRKVICDVSRGIDYLEMRPEIDKRYIGFIGHGYGGKMAIWSMALEPRIRAGVGHRGATTYRENVRRSDWIQTEFVVPRLLQVADLHHILSLVAPRPFLLSTTDDDPQSADAQTIYRQALPTYERHGVPQRLSFYSYPGGDVFERDMRHNAYTWLDSWLKPF
ncbi:MAG: dienelactone hydrolase family protein [Anaerolineae bacterium]|nr:dienelactone hydrolase family protein [Anaerolineae bacterium]